MAAGTTSRSRSRLAWISSVALAFLAIGAAPASAAPPPEFFGVVPSTGLTQGDVPKMEKSGVGTMRFQFFWPAIEATPGDFRWAAHDGLMKQAAAAGIRVFPTLYGTPGWANFLAGQDGCGSTCAPAADSSRNAYARFARAAAERYGPGGDFWTASGGDCSVPSLCPQEPPPCGCTDPVPIRSWQIWNEQNSEKYYEPSPNPGDYAQLVRVTSEAIRSVDPDAEIVLGGMWGPDSAGDLVMPTVEYLGRFYSTPGIEASFDSIAVHPYGPNLEAVSDLVRESRQVLKREGDSATGLWVTELGWASGGPANYLVKTPKAQARLLREAFEYLIKRRTAWRLQGITWFSWRDATAEETDCEWCPQAGLRSISGAEKLAGRAFKRLAVRSAR